MGGRPRVLPSVSFIIFSAYQKITDAERGTAPTVGLCPPNRSNGRFAPQRPGFFCLVYLSKFLLIKRNQENSAAFLRIGTIASEFTNVRSYLSSVLLLATAIFLIVFVPPFEVQNSRGAGIEGIRALCERENITDTQTRECIVKMKLEKQRLAQR